MFNKIFKLDPDAAPHDGDCMNTKDANGVVSNGELHSQIMEGVDPYAGNEFLRIDMKNDFPVEWLDKYFPMPKNPQDTTGYTGE